MTVLSTLFLTQDELKELTDLKIPSAQRRWLTKHSYPFEVSASGKLKVLRSIVFQRLSSIQSSFTNEPNFEAIR